MCASEVLEHLGMSSFLKTTVLFKCCKGGQFVRTWLHGNLYIVHYKGFECAETWHSCVQSEAANPHLLLYPEMLEMTSLCFKKNLHWNTYMTCCVWQSGWFHQEDQNGARESLGTVILRVITEYRIFLFFPWCKQWLLWRGLRLAAVITLVHLHFHPFITDNKRVGAFFTAQFFVPTLFFFHFLWRRLIPLFID